MHQLHHTNSSTTSSSSNRSPASTNDKNKNNNTTPMTSLHYNNNSPNRQPFHQHQHVATSALSTTPHTTVISSISASSSSASSRRNNNNNNKSPRWNHHHYNFLSCLSSSSSPTIRWITMLLIGSCIFIGLQIHLMHSFYHVDSENSFTTELYNGFLRLENDVTKEGVNDYNLILQQQQQKLQQKLQQQRRVSDTNSRTKTQPKQEQQYEKGDSNDDDSEPEETQSNNNNKYPVSSSMGIAQKNASKLSHSLPSTQEIDQTTNNNNNNNNVIIPRYYQVHDQILEMLKGHPRGNLNYKTSFNKATVVTKAPWIDTKKYYKFCNHAANCCAEPMAISLEQDEYHIRNNVDGMDLSDVEIQHYGNTGHLDFLAQNFNEQILPCLQPGVIINLDNHLKLGNYFWGRVRPNITVPYILITTKSDGYSPVVQAHADRLRDPKLMKWYGTNPKNYPAIESFTKYQSTKFVPFPLGLSHFHNQAKYLTKYLEITNYANPFKDKSRWTNNMTIDFDHDVIVQFALRLNHRKRLWATICPVNTTVGIHCNHDPKVEPTVWYAEASKYRFGVSPPGGGWDCYRTYELLLLGIIPIVDSNDNVPGHVLFEGLPVIHVENLVQIESKEALIDIIQNYIASDEFQKNDFQLGWEKLFLKYWRRRILQDANREILTDDCGKEYYIGYRYTPTNDPPIYCNQEHQCEIVDGEIGDQYALGNFIVNMTTEYL